MWAKRRSSRQASFNNVWRFSTHWFLSPTTYKYPFTYHLAFLPFCERIFAKSGLYHSTQSWSVRARSAILPPDFIATIATIVNGEVLTCRLRFREALLFLALRILENSLWRQSNLMILSRSSGSFVDIDSSLEITFQSKKSSFLAAWTKVKNMN